jgi:hypothetical protein
MHESAGGFYMKQNFVPAVYAENPMGVSEKYSFIPTTRVIDDLGQLGWHPEVITGSRSNPVAKHLIRFRQSEIVGPETPEIVLVNSHDGLSSFQLKAGIFPIGLWKWLGDSRIIVFGDLNPSHPLHIRCGAGSRR